MRYQVYCNKLPCLIYASSRAEALRKTRRTIDIFFDSVIDQAKDNPSGIRNMLEIRLGWVSQGSGKAEQFTKQTSIGKK